MLEEKLDYWLSRFLLVNACTDCVLDEEESNLLLAETYVNEDLLLPLYKSPIRVGEVEMNSHGAKSHGNAYGCFQAPAEDRKNRKYCLTSKMICTSCGSHYGPIPLHATTYNYLVWACKGRSDKRIHCHEKYIYDRVLNFLLHKAARDCAYRRKIPEKIEIAFKSKSSKLKKYYEKLWKKDVLQMVFDPEDILFMIDEIAMESEQNMAIIWITGKCNRYKIPGYSPRKDMIL